MKNWAIENNSEYDDKIEKVDAKIEKWWKDIWTWFADVVSWTTTMVAKTFGAGLSLVWAWAAKVWEMCTPKTNPEKKSQKANQAKIHLEKAKAKGKKAAKSVPSVLWWWVKAIKWAWRIAVHSVNKSIKEMRAEEKIPETWENPENVENQAA